MVTMANLIASTSDYVLWTVCCLPPNLAHVKNSRYADWEAHLSIGNLQLPIRFRVFIRYSVLWLDSVHAIASS